MTASFAVIGELLLKSYTMCSHSIVFCVLFSVMFALITFFDQPKLYCKYQDLYKSINNPTTFCTIAGTNLFFINSDV